MGRKDKPRIIPEQDKRICGSICICQLTVVVSCVAIVYLSVAVYMPSYKAFQSGFEPDTVMCQAIQTDMVNCAANWASCGEWCLTKSSGSCPQIHATVRRNGTDVLFENCTRSVVTHCPQVNPRDLKKYNCNNGSSSECTSLTGVFGCKLGHCANFSEIYECHFKADGIIVDAERENMKLNGFFFCKNSNCTQIKKHDFPRDRYCSKITTSLMNTYVMHNNSVTTMDCEAAYALTEAAGSEPGLRLDKPMKIWDENVGYLLTSCIDIQKVSETNNFIAYDCLNGTVLEPSVVPEPFTNFTTFWRIYENSTAILDPTQRYLPKQSSLTIYNKTKLFINLDGCVNTLRGECKEFIFTHGQDGNNRTAQSRYQCYYNKLQSDFVVARYDLAKTWRELMIAVIVPTSLFVISLTVLCVISQTVQVGDDAKMRCQYCLSAESDADEGNVVTSQPGKSRAGEKETGGVTDVSAPLTTTDDRSNGLRMVSAKCGGGLGDKGDREINDLSAAAADTTEKAPDEHVLVPLSPCTDLSQAETEMAESCLSVVGGAEDVIVKSEVDPETPLMIL